MLDTQLKALVEQQVAFHAEYVTDFMRTHDYGLLKLLDPAKKQLVTPPDLMRRGNDILAAAYSHAIALYQNNGDDCIDAQGNTIELKLAYINSSKCFISQRGALQYGSDTTFTHAINAKFRVYDGTADDHFDKDTAFVLISHDHNCFITGFMMKGETINDILRNSERTTVQRDVSLNRFIRDGYEFGSSVPHIGWERYMNALFNYVAAREGKSASEADARQAIDEWVSLANPDNLNKL